jgi:hypothetical protein
MKPPEFSEILDTVRRDVIRAASHYPLVTGFFFKVMNQAQLLDHYPWLLPDLFLAVTGNIVMTLGRLFEVTENPRTACLMTFLSRIERHHARDAGVKPHLKERRADFLAKVPQWRIEIKKANLRLAVRRNADLAHNDLTKVGRSDIKWTEIKDMISLAERILKTYFHAFHEANQKFVVVNSEWEVPNFLKWARLDDYAAHWKADRDTRRAIRKDWIRRRQAGDPTAPERPPV